jgi:putative PIN family toxin of toxin-antitoxin system
MFPDRLRVVIDTNIFISRLLMPSSVPGRAFFLAEREAVLLLSEDLIREALDVLSRSKFDTYVSAEMRTSIMRDYISLAELVDITANIRACRDPQDDKLLSLAISGGAQWIITGDDDLLVLDPFQGVTIGTPRRFLDVLQA